MINLRSHALAAAASLRGGAAAGCLTLASAFGLKLAYSKAGAGELEWVLAPSCWFASALGGIQFTHEVGAGFITHAPRMVVGTACAGVNFMVVCWLALFFAVQARFSGQRGKLALWAATLLGAYLATIATNGLRIVLAAALYDMDIYAGWLTKGRLHRLLGVVLYCSVLFGLCRAAEHWTRRWANAGVVSRPSRFALLSPLFWYLLVALGVPLANRSFLRNPAQFAEHALVTLGVGLAVMLVFRLSSRRAAA